MMLVMVTFVGSFIILFASGYMHGDPGYPRFFAEVSLFIFHDGSGTRRQPDPAVRLLGRRRPVQLPADRVLVREESAANAARKAFLVTRSATPVSSSGFCSCGPASATASI
jgi:NADH-quinone oxidoreductase subunit L